jgi:hypothetical protein
MRVTPRDSLFQEFRYLKMIGAAAFALAALRAAARFLDAFSYHTFDARYGKALKRAFSAQREANRNILGAGLAIIAAAAPGGAEFGAALFDERPVFCG